MATGRSAALRSLAAALLLLGCGPAPSSQAPSSDAHPAPPARSDAKGTEGFGAVGSQAGGGSGTPTVALGVSGLVEGREVKLGSAFLLTPDVEGPVELHAFEASLAPEQVCPAGSSGDEVGVSLRVVLPDTRLGDDASLVHWTTAGHTIAASGVRIEVAGRPRPGSSSLATIDVRGEGGARLSGAMPVHACRDDREAP